MGVLDGSSARAPWDVLVESSSDILTVHEPDGAIRVASPGIARLLGIPADQLVGANPFAFVHRADRSRLIDEMVQLREQPDAVRSCVLRVRHADGGWRWLEVNTRNLMNDPRVEGVVAASRDVTDRIAVEQALRASEQRHRDMVTQMPHGIAVLDDTGRVLFANPAGARLVGLPSPQDALGRPLADFVAPEDVDAVAALVREAVGGARVPPQQHELVTADGDRVVAIATILPYDWDGRPAALSMLQDVTGLRHAEQAREVVTEQFRLLLESSAEGVVGLDTEGRVTFLNPAAEHLLGLGARDVLGRNGHELFHHSRADGTPIAVSECPCQQAARGGRPAVVSEEVFWRLDGRPVPVDYRVMPLRSDSPSGAVLTFTDVSERLRAREQLQSVAEFQRAVLDSLPAQTAVVDDTGRIVAVNAAWLASMREHGGTSEKLGVGASFLDACEGVQGPERREALAAAAGLRRILAGQASSFSCDVTSAAPGEQTRHFSLQMVPLRGAHGGVVIGYSDITDRKRLEVAAAHRATHDELTGLPNRTLLLERLQHSLSERGNAPLAVLFVDLDHFKLVNDGYGHEAGDQVLRELARRLSAVVRPSDTVARLAGDEFVVVCEHLPYATEAQRLADRIIAALARPFPIAGTELTLGASVGIALAEDHRVSPDDVLAAADQAMFHAKGAGRNRYALFDEGVQQSSRLRLEQAVTLRRLVDEDRLAVHFQPVVDLADGRVTGVEALLRWDPVDHLHDASTAVAVAEEIGLIGTIDRWVLRAACEQAASFRTPDGELLRLSVNVAPQQLDRALVEYVVRTTAETGYPITSLTLELTERTVMADPKAAIPVLAGLRALGARIAVDDFGYGQASLSQLRDLPLDLLKMDSRFVAGLAGTDHDDRVIRAIIELARALGLGVVAEGVERSDQRHRLVELGCREGQGHLFSTAQPADSVRALLARSG